MNNYKCGPWGKHNYSEEFPESERLSKELDDFIDWINPTEEETQIRLFTVYKYSKIIESFLPKTTAVTQGSSITNSFIPTSDIDIIIFGMPEDIDVASTLSKLVNHLWNIRSINKAIVLKHAKVPIAKIADKEFGINIDIGIGNINGPLNVPRVLKYFSTFPLLRPTLLFFKVLTTINDLHDPATGGFGSNHLMQIILFVIMQNKEGEFKNAADLIVAVLELLVNRMNFFLTGITTVDGGHFFSKIQIEIDKNCLSSIVCQDPQLHSNYYGIKSKKSTDLVNLSRSVLNLIKNGSALCKYVSLLTRILKGYEVIEDAKKDFEELFQIWKLPPKEFERKIQSRQPLQKSKSTPNLGKDKFKIFGHNERKRHQERDFRNIHSREHKDNESRSYSSKKNKNNSRHEKQQPSYKKKPFRR